MSLVRADALSIPRRWMAMVLRAYGWTVTEPKEEQ